MKIVLVATHNERYFNTMIRSLEYGNINYDVIGMGTKWNGYMTKFNLIIQWLKKQRSDSIIVHADAFDSFYYGNIVKMEKLFMDSGYDIIMSKGVKKNIFYIYSNYKQYGVFPDKHINSGMYIGYAGKLLDYFTELLPLCDDDDDERCVNINRNLLEKYNVGIDHNYDFFQNVNIENLHELELDKTFLFSFPGAFSIPDSVIERLPFKVDKIKVNGWMMFWRVVSNLIKYGKVEVILILFLVSFLVYWGYKLYKVPEIV